MAGEGDALTQGKPALWGQHGVHCHLICILWKQLILYLSCARARTGSRIPSSSARRAVTTKTVRETEAAALAYVVSQAIGLETGTAAVDYIQLHRRDANLLLKASNTIVGGRQDSRRVLENQNLLEVVARLDSAPRWNSYFFGGFRRRIASSSNA
jgi:hypothetical protein